MRKGTVRGALVALALALVGAAPAAAQTVVGRVLDDVTDLPVVEARVTLLNDNSDAVAAVVTSADGRFSLPARRPGRHRLRVERQGYAVHMSPYVDLTPSETLEVEFRLAPSGILLAPLTVIARRDIERGRDGFARRRELGRGVFRDQVAIALMEPTRPSDIFRDVEGIQVSPSDDGTMVIRATRGWGCVVVFADHSPDPLGVHIRASNRMPGAGLQPTSAGQAMHRPPQVSRQVIAHSPAGTLDDVLTTRTLRAVEIYPQWRDVPVEIRESYRAPAIWPENVYGPCGVAFIWTHVGW